MRKVLTVEGRYVGFILRSYWNDPLTNEESIIYVSENSQGGVEVEGRVKCVDEISEFKFDVIPPLRLFGNIRNCNVDLMSEFQITGEGERNQSFSFYGNNSIRFNVMHIQTETIINNDLLMIETENDGVVQQQQRLNLVNKGRLSSAGSISRISPWSVYSLHIDVPNVENIPSKIKQVFELLHLIIIREPRYIYTNDRHEIDSDDYTMRWLGSMEGYQDLLNVLVAVGLVSQQKGGAAGSYTVRIDIPSSVLESLRKAGQKLLQGDRREISQAQKAFWDRYTRHRE